MLQFHLWQEEEAAERAAEEKKGQISFKFPFDQHILAAKGYLKELHKPPNSILQMPYLQIQPGVVIFMFYQLRWWLSDEKGKLNPIIMNISC